MKNFSIWKREVKQVKLLEITFLILLMRFQQNLNYAGEKFHNGKIVARL